MTVGSLLAYDPNNVKPGWIAFGVVMALVIATFFLWRSMNTQLRKINVPHRADLESDSTRDDAGPTEGPDEDRPR